MRKSEILREILNDPELIEVARLKIEDFLIEMRDSGCFIYGRGNGFTVNSYDGQPSSAMRLGTPEGIRMALDAIADKLGEEE